MLKKMSFVVAFAVLMTLPMYAQRHRSPAGVGAQRDGHQVCAGKGSKLVYTNLTGPLHHKYNNTVGYFVDGTNFFGQVLAQGFTPTSDVKFADVYMPMGVYTDGGGANYSGTTNVYLQSDAGGVPSGVVLDGPLSQCNGISNFNNGLGGNFVEFDCVTCPNLTAGTAYWIVAQQDVANVELTWDEVRGITDTASPFAFNQTNNAFGDFVSVPTGYSRSAYQVDGN
jgi:hypothetical protein